MGLAWAAVALSAVVLASSAGGIETGQQRAAAASNICGSSPIIGRAVMNAVNLSLPELAPVQRAASAGDLNGACEELALYYSRSNTSAWYRWTPPSGWNPHSDKKAGGQADGLLNDVFVLSGVRETAKIPRNPDGGLNWYDEGPKHDPEFMNCLNRHDAFKILMAAWHATGNTVYATYFSNLVQDWVTHLPCRDGVSRTTWNASGSWEQPCATGTMESPWRVLEAGIRTADPWPVAFFGFQRAEAFTVSSRVLMLLGVSEHFAVLKGPGRSAHTPNWQMTQTVGLLQVASAFTELNGAAEARAFAIAEQEKLLHDSVYPDGIETEEAYGYDMGTAFDFFNALQVMERGHAGAPPTFKTRVEAMFNYGAFIPDQYDFGPRNGDADLGHARWSEEAADYFRRPDWVYAHTSGENGTRPAGVSPSSIFPWGGQVALRSSYERNSTWMWFAVGPYGSSGHAHRAKLTVAIRAFGSMLLVDSGRFQYNGVGPSKVLHDEYSRTTHAHNVITIDQCGQRAEPAVASAPVSNDTFYFTSGFDVVRNSMSLYEGLEGNATHTRAVMYVRDRYFVVVDRVVTDRKRALAASWHAHPNATVATDAARGFRGAPGRVLFGGVSTSSGRPTTAALHLIPSTGGADWASHEQVKGQNRTAAHDWQGWYSATYSGHSPAPVVTFNGTCSEAEPAVFAWLAVPLADAAHRDPSASLQIAVSQAGTVTAHVSLGGVVDTLTIPLDAPASEASVAPAQHLSR